MHVVVPAACLLALAASSAGAFESLPRTDGGTGPIALGADSDSDEIVFSPAPDPLSVQYLAFVEGDPGVPGDGILAGAAGGLSSLQFEVDLGLSPISLGDAGDGFTVSAFPPGSTPASTVNLQVVLATEGRLRRLCSIAIAGTTVLAPSVNGVQGAAVVLSRDELDAYAGVVRSRPECSHLSPSGLFLSRVAMFNHFGWNVGQLDALAVGFGANAFPSENMAPATATAAP